MTDETLQPEIPEEEVRTPDIPVPPEAEASAESETQAPDQSADLFDEDGETERFTAEGGEPIFADEADEGIADEPGEASAACPAPKKKGPILAAVLAAAAVVVVAVILVCTLFAPKKAAPFDVVLDYVDDCLPDNATDVAMETVGIPADTVLLTVDGVDISAEEYLYWLYDITSYYNMMSLYSGSAMDLTAEVQEGGPTWDENLKGIARDNAALMALVPDLAEEFGVELTPEELQTVADRRAENVESEGLDQYAYQLQSIGVSDATVLKLNAAAALFSKVQQVWIDQLAQGVTPEAVADYVEENDILKAKHILLMTVDQTTRQPLDEATIAQKRAKAEELLVQLRDDPSKFDELMQANSEDTGLVANPDGYTFTAGNMVEAFESGTRALEYGEISDIIESEYGYHIILRLDPDSEELRQDIAYEDFNDAVRARVDQADVEESEAYASFTTADYYENLQAFQKALPSPETETGGEGETGAEDEPEVVDQSQAELEPAS